ncbi:MAG: preprotein translocase subunit SecE [Hyphomicrobiaceae bacterium]|nr:preprotein translocase subunit SecE [Hyphomicrobiaceae bacterium]
MANPLNFMREVREEVSKVSWPTRRETVITTIMVFIMAIAAAIFFMLADQVISKLVKIVLGFGG